MTENLYDLIIIGAGPAGLSAAIYMSRAKYKVLVLEKEKFGGQITITDEIVNYPGIPRTSGKALTEGMRAQAEAFGAEFKIAEVLDMRLESDIKTLATTAGEFAALGVVLAVGANPRKLGFKGENEFAGRGVAYCATCDGEFFTGMDIFVIGGGFAAVEEGMFLTKYAKTVTMMVREDDFTCARTISDKIAEYDNIKVNFNTEIVSVSGDTMVNEAVFVNNKTGAETRVSADKNGGFGVFVFAGYVPNTKWLPKSIELNEQGYIVTDRNQKTNIDGVYAAGDVCVKNLRQVVTAVSDGAVAATSLEKHVAEIHEKLNIPEFETAKPAKTVHQPKNTAAADENGFLSPQIREQLKAVIEKFDNPVILKLWRDGSNLSAEIEGFLGEFEGLSDKITVERGEGESPKITPSIEICRADGGGTGMYFHAVPGGHEINSFIVALYNAAGPGKKPDAELEDEIKSISESVNIKILVSLSCTMCPETVMSAQQIAALSDNVEAEVFDIAHYPELKERYKVMSVPCMVVNDSAVSFGKKNTREVFDIVTAARR
ncbi:MAG: FAD-dependent oxidoreductase [Firmicutes bacterium]|nr:FAD-dependent oxidoreductase [Bacillota bacterium]